MKKNKKLFAFLGTSAILPLGFAISCNDPQNVSKQEYKSEYIRIMKDLVQQALKSQNLPKESLDASLSIFETSIDTVLKTFDDNYNFANEYKGLKEAESKLKNLDFNELNSSLLNILGELRPRENSNNTKTK
ncbi:hypothetical protein [Mycoplasma leonicaptivi]|uniref:hypothetical protein n=1 Tax=Mycoplasma leonicaptivi TaxID=36742 RepID=UPI000481A33B|nr:hypothetical protein [Mycoplasma leonicaptivi]